MLVSEMVQLRYLKGASAVELWEFHKEGLNERLPCQPISLKNHERVPAMIERLHTALRDFHLDRGVFQPLSEAEQEKLAAADAATPSETPAFSSETAAPSLEQE